MSKIFNHIKPETHLLLEKLTTTLLYEGYSLFPYHRSAIKNQKPIPFGVIYPGLYHDFNQYAPAKMKVEYIVVGNSNLEMSAQLVFLHLLKSDSGGWKTIERKIDLDNLSLTTLLKNKITTRFAFDEPTENGCIELMPVTGEITIEAENIRENVYKAGISISNTSSVQGPASAIRDEALLQSFLATHIVVSVTHGEFISAQNPGEEYGAEVGTCEHIGLWQILVDRENTAALFSPIIVHDYPEIHPQSKTDLFDSTEIIEALMLHLAVMSDEEKNRIADSDDKLREMLHRAGEIDPRELIALHGGMYEDEQNR